MRIALAGDTMLGRGVAEKIAGDPEAPLFSDEVIDAFRAGDLAVVNLECCISTRGERWPDPGKPFFFRAPPEAINHLERLGVDCVALANNHALDFGRDALLDTLSHLEAEGIEWAGAGRDAERARAPAVVAADGFRLAVLSVTDHPAEYAAGPDTPGVAYADLRAGVPDWLLRDISAMEADAVLVTPHWGPNMNPEPLDHVRVAGERVVEAGATLVAGHSAHVFQGVRPPVLYDLGDFVDDYAVDPVLRNDLGLMFIVTLDEEGLSSIEAVPLKLDYCYTRLAEGDDARWIKERFTTACTAFGNLRGGAGRPSSRRRLRPARARLSQAVRGDVPAESAEAFAPFGATT
jgi:poly-gamma-glutamate capsule biosynthesis protein CapA/YwtB (metallophosphatase superfamily)